MSVYEDCRKEVKRIAGEMNALETDRDRFKAQHDALYLAVEEEAEGLRRMADLGVKPDPSSDTYAVIADRLQKLLAAAGEKREVPDYGKLVGAASEAVAMLGPGDCSQNSCEGCRFEMAEARSILDAALARLASEQKGGGA